MTKQYKYKFIDLFAGLGGFHFALQELGCECVFASEIKEDLRNLYRINFPGTTIEGDITKIKPEDIPAHDILCAGFPCQPFSQAGKRQGFYDEKDRGNLFYIICDILRYHHPQYVILENVSNLKGHDGGNTWNTIKQLLEDIGYDVAEPAILSPHQWGIPQHRRRIYIVCRYKEYGDLNGFSFPSVSHNRKCDIKGIIDETDLDYIKLKQETRDQLNLWQEFIDLTIAHNQKIPRFPIWAMEFGADYEYKKKAPAFQTLEELRGKRGHLGRLIDGDNKADCIGLLPIYSQTAKNEVFPKWKIRYIEQNRNFYKINKTWLDLWMAKIIKLDNSHLKFEWNCGDNAAPTLDDKIIQFRASGIRVKLPTFSPALNLVGTQIPIFPWIHLPKASLQPGEPDRGRYMTRKEAAKLQGMKELKFGDEQYALSIPRSFEALGNAVNVTIVKHIAKNLLNSK
jgi:DNA (cytosine-5)-methyltransferase 1